MNKNDGFNQWWQGKAKFYDEYWDKLYNSGNITQYITSVSFKNGKASEERYELSLVPLDLIAEVVGMNKDKCSNISFDITSENFEKFKPYLKDTNAKIDINHDENHECWFMVKKKEE